MVSRPFRVTTLSRTNARTEIGDTKRSNVDHVGRSTSRNRGHPWCMRKLLILLPVLALASCSSGHDLMSNKPFRITCVEEGKENSSVLVASPDLPQATVMITGSKKVPELTYELAVKTPIRFELRRSLGNKVSHVISINRQSGEISTGNISHRQGSIDLTPLPENIKCSTEKL